MTNSATIDTPRNATQRALPVWRTIWAERAGVRPPVAWIDGAAVKRSAEGAGVSRSRRAGRRCSGERSWSLMAGRAVGRRSYAADRALRRDDAGLADGDRERAEGDLRRVEGQR